MTIPCGFLEHLAISCPNPDAKLSFRHHMELALGKATRDHFLAITFQHRVADRSFESSHVHLQKVSTSIKKSHHGEVDPNVAYPHLTSAEAKPLLAPVVAWTTLSRRWSACQAHRALG